MTDEKSALAEVLRDWLHSHKFARNAASIRARACIVTNTLPVHSRVPQLLGFRNRWHSGTAGTGTDETRRVVGLDVGRYLRLLGSVALRPHAQHIPGRALQPNLSHAEARLLRRIRWVEEHYRDRAIGQGLLP